VSERFLSGTRIGVSVSNSANLAQLGLAQEHVEDDLVEITRYLIAAGATVVYGGDLRANGFTELLLEVVARHHPNNDSSTRFESVLAWPVHMSMAFDCLAAAVEVFAPAGGLVLLDEKGGEMSMLERSRLEDVAVPDEGWGPPLTAMRRTLAARCDARIAAGGATTGYRGDMPGVAEEVLLSLAADKPTFVTGALGGCALDIGLLCGLADSPVGVTSTWPGQENFTALAEALNPGLERHEAKALASPALGTEMLILLLKGLRNSVKRSSSPPGA
jgi:hypothetical protein